jgi:hypothetical protein
LGEVVEDAVLVVIPAILVDPDRPDAEVLQRSVLAMVLPLAADGDVPRPSVELDGEFELWPVDVDFPDVDVDVVLCRWDFGMLFEPAAECALELCRDDGVALDRCLDGLEVEVLVVDGFGDEVLQLAGGAVWGEFDQDSGDGAAQHPAPAGELVGVDGRVGAVKDQRGVLAAPVRGWEGQLDLAGGSDRLPRGGGCGVAEERVGAGGEQRPDQPSAARQNRRRDDRVDAAMHTLS